MLERQTSGTLTRTTVTTIASGVAAGVVGKRGLTFGTIFTGSDPGNITFYASPIDSAVTPDAPKYAPTAFKVVKDASGGVVTIAAAANGSYSLPAELATCDYFIVVSANAVAVDISIYG